jgi:hypothetical protein
MTGGAERRLEEAERRAAEAQATAADNVKRREATAVALKGGWELKSDKDTQPQGLWPKKELSKMSNKRGLGLVSTDVPISEVTKVTQAFTFERWARA